MFRSRRARVTVVIAAAALTGLQIVTPRPTNPHVDPARALKMEAAPQVYTLLRRACYNCHSNETVWPWYVHVPAVSLLVVADVNEARGQLNFSNWNSYNSYDRADLLDKVCDDVSHGKMPLWQYRLVHPAARLTDTDIKAICGWSQAEAARLVGAG